MPSTPRQPTIRLDAAAAARTACLMRDGFCCSESVLAAICEQAMPGFDRSWVRLATGFCGGVGHSRDELCGALAGVMAVGLLYGRSELGAEY